MNLKPVGQVQEEVKDEGRKDEEEEEEIVLK